MPAEVRRVETDEFRGDRVVDQSFAGEQFVHHRYFSRRIEGCKFLKCRFEDLRMWDTQIADTLFDECDLRGAALGGILEGRCNRFHRVAFRKTDLRRLACSSTEFVECKFENCRFGPVDFQGSRFIRCSFKGEIRDALFYDRGFGESTQPANEMTGCDFTEARLRLCGFRRLNLSTVKWPLERTFIVYGYRRFLETAIREAKDSEKVFRGMMGHSLKWAGLRQETGCFDHEDLADWLGENWESRIEEIQRLV